MNNFTLRTAEKCLLFVYVQKVFKTLRYISIFARFDEKPNCLGNLLETFQKSLEKITKNALFYPILNKILKSQR